MTILHRPASRTFRPFAFALTFAAATAPVHAANYTYHGDLMDGDAPAEGAYDLRVRALPQPGARKALAEPTELPGVLLRAGRFSVSLDLPEDPDGVTWVEVAVRKAGSGDVYEVLGDPQALVKANSTCPGAWALDGNSGIPAGSFLGIADIGNTPLVLKASNSPVATFTPHGGDDGEAPSVAMGSSANSASGAAAVVAGGGATLIGGSACPECANHASGDFASIGGGRGNTADEFGGSVGGGMHNTADNSWAWIGGGADNTAGGLYSAVGGGQNNVASGEHSVVGGGENNLAAFNNATIGGGDGNYAAGLGTVAGGIGNSATGFTSTVGGGGFNCAGGTYSWAGGNNAKVRSPDGTTDRICGSNSADSGGDEGSFVWADAHLDAFVTTGPNQFLVRASGGVGINTATFGNAVDLRLSELVIRNPDAGGNVDMTLINQTNRGYGLAVVPGAGGAAGEFYISETDARTPSVGFANRLRIDAAGTTFVQGGAVGNLSDVRLKKNFAPIEHPLDTLLALQGQMFEYRDPAKSMNAPGPRMGFVAQQVQQAIPSWVAPTGAEGYLAVTPVGFEALAVEAIRDLKTESDLRIDALERENAALRATLDEVLQRLQHLDPSGSRAR